MLSNFFEYLFFFTNKKNPQKNQKPTKKKNNPKTKQQNKQKTELKQNLFDRTGKNISKDNNLRILVTLNFALK